MEPMLWDSKEKDQKANAYLDKINHAPYGTILLVSFVMFCLLSLLVLISVF